MVDPLCDTVVRLVDELEEEALAFLKEFEGDSVLTGEIDTGSNHSLYLLKKLPMN